MTIGFFDDKIFLIKILENDIMNFRDKEKCLSSGEKKMLYNAKQILISELILAEGSSTDFINSKIEDIIEKN